MTPSDTAGAPPQHALALETRSAAQTRQLAATLAGAARPGDRLALIGPLGAGKTQFAKGFAAGLGVSAIVNSPSFTLMAEYPGRLSLFHQDLYRLGGAADAIAGGLFDERQDAGVTLTEWADRLESGIDPERLEIRFTVIGDEERRLELVAPAGSRYDRYVAAGASWAPDPARAR